MSSSLASYTLNYDGLKRLSNTVVKTYNNAALMTRSYTYLAGAATNETTTLVSTYKVKKPTSGNFASYTYSYDALGNITGISGSSTASYTYDALNQLTGAVQDGVTYAYTYNKAGNILSKTVNNGTPITYTYGDTNGWKDLLTEYNGAEILYDNIGNPTKWYDDTVFTWVNGRRLESISAVSGVHPAMSFTYDSDGLRLTKNVDGVEHRYTWQGGKLISETWGGKKIEFFYGPEDSIDGFNYKAGPNSSVYVYYYVKNLQGDVVAIINKDGELRAEYTYDPFGKVLSATGTMADINPIRYRGYYYDSELGFYYLQSRYYDPNLCRFINADGLASTGQGFLGCNMFAYCNNNPVNEADPAGDDSMSGYADPNLYFIDNARPLGSAALALGLLAGAYFAHKAGIVLGRYLLAELSKKASSSTTTAKVSASSPAPPPGPGNNRNDSEKRNWEHKKDGYLKQQLKDQGTDPHSIKKEFLGNNAKISKYDLYVDKGTGQIGIFEKGSGKLVDITEYFIIKIK